MVAANLHNVPSQPTPFIGREQEIAELLTLMNKPDCRLLTLVGPGGIGKTRLALEAAIRQSELFPHGVYFVPLAPLNAATDIVTTVISVLGILIGDDGTPQAELVKFLSQRHLLLIMDNFEHVLAGADLLTDILRAAPDVKIMATSREVLNLQEEWVWQLSGMGFPQAGQTDDIEEYSALQLFFDRAQRVRRDFSITDELDCAIRICQLVEGMPLALELAASWLKTLACRDIIVQIQRGIDFLASRVRDVPQRHRNIRAVFDHSWQLLTEEEQSVFPRFAVFRGGFTLQATEKVMGASLIAISGLVEKSMLRRLPSGRYDIHELLRQYAAEKLNTAGATEITQNAHLRYFAEFMREHAIDIKGRRQLEGLNEIEADFENVRTAWQRAIAQVDYAALDAMMECLALFCDMRTRYQAGYELFHTAVEQLNAADEEPHPTWNRLRMRWIQTWSLQEIPSIPEHIAEGLNNCLVWAERFDDRNTLDVCHWLQSELIRPRLIGSAEVADGIRLYEHLYQDVHRIADSYYVGRILRGMAHFFMNAKDERFDAINEHYLEVTRLNGDRSGMAHGICYMGAFAGFDTIAYAATEQNFRQAQAIFEEMGDRKSVGVIKWFLGVLALYKGDFEEAEKLAREHLVMVAETNYRMDSAGVLLILGEIAVLRADYHEGRRLIMESYAQLPIHVQQSLLEPISAAIVAYGLGSYQAARVTLSVFMNWATEKNRFWVRWVTTRGFMFVLGALLLTDDGEKQWAVEVLGMVFARTVHTGWLEKWRLLNQLRASLKAELGEAAYQAAWEQGATRDVEQTTHELIAYFSEADAPQDSAIHSQANQALPEPLTERELEVLVLLAKGYSNREIAEELTVVVGTVKSHVHFICQKLSAANRTQVVIKAKQQGLVN